MESLYNNSNATISARIATITKDPMEEKVALVVGVTGVVGACLVEILTKSPPGEWKCVHGIARRPRPPWFQERYPSVSYTQCDLLDRDVTFAKLGSSSSSLGKGIGNTITHVFFVAWVSCDNEEDNCRHNGAMLKNLLDALCHIEPGGTSRLTHVCLQTGIKHYIGSHHAFEENHDHYRQVYVEDAPCLLEPNFYYVQEGILFESITRLNASRGQDMVRQVSWSIHRPGLIFGFSPNALVNSALAIAVYASICKQEGLPLVFPGTRLTWDFHLEAVDANLVAEQEIWAATNPSARNQAFNVTNGDNMTWNELWTFIAQYFGLVAATSFQGEGFNDPHMAVTSLVEWLQGKIKVWDQIVQQHHLYPTQINEFMNGMWVIDLMLNRMPTGKCSMEKSVRHGFLESRDTKASLFSMFDRMKEMRLIP